MNTCRNSRIHATIAVLLSCVLLVLFIAVDLQSAYAADVIKQKDGKTYEGQITQENEDWIEIKVTFGSIVRSYVISRSSIESITKDSDNGDIKKEETDKKSNSDINKSADADVIDADQPVDLHNKKVFVIPLHEMVGTYFRADKLKEAVDFVRPMKPDVIILEINSGGGMLLEIYKLREYIAEIRDEFRVVAWIKSAISAAAMTAFNAREIYMMSEGNIGSATAFNGATGQALTGKELEDWLDYARKLFVDAGYSPYIAQCMVAEKYTLSADREVMPNGEIKVTWYDDDSGEFMLCRPGEILNMDARTAEKFGVSLGTPDDTDEFAELLHLDGWVEVSNKGREIMETWWNTVKTAETVVPNLYREYALYGDGQKSSIGRQIQIVQEMIKWSRKLGEVGEWFYGLEEEKLQLQLRQLRRQMKG